MSEAGKPSLLVTPPCTFEFGSPSGWEMALKVKNGSHIFDAEEGGVVPYCYSRQHDDEYEWGQIFEIELMSSQGGGMGCSLMISLAGECMVELVREVVAALIPDGTGRDQEILDIEDRLLKHLRAYLQRGKSGSPR